MQGKKYEPQDTNAAHKSGAVLPTPTRNLEEGFGDPSSLQLLFLKQTTTDGFISEPLSLNFKYKRSLSIWKSFGGGRGEN